VRCGRQYDTLPARELLRLPLPQLLHQVCVCVCRACASHRKAGHEPCHLARTHEHTHTQTHTHIDPRSAVHCAARPSRAVAHQPRAAAPLCARRAVRALAVADAAHVAVGQGGATWLWLWLCCACALVAAAAAHVAVGQSEGQEHNLIDAQLGAPGLRSAVQSFVMYRPPPLSLVSRR
jgi:hypothetical protein